MDELPSSGPSAFPLLRFPFPPRLPLDFFADIISVSFSPTMDQINEFDQRVRGS